jgi:hypothetical protein
VWQLDNSLSYHRSRFLWWALATAIILFLFYPSLVAHYVLASDPLIFNDDARQQLVAMLRFEDPSLFQNDFVVDYYLDILPIGYRTTFAVANTWLSVDVISTILPYILLLVTAAAMGFCARKLGGNIVAFVTVALVLGSPVYLDRMAGGLPRAFGFPILAFAMLTVSYGRVLWLSATAAVAILFYPVVAVPIGLLLALLLLVLPKQIVGTGSDWTFRNRCLYLVVALVLAILLALPTIIESSKYGSVITPALTLEFPEAGSGGRYADVDLQESVWQTTNVRVHYAKGLWAAGRPMFASLRGWLQEKNHSKYFPTQQVFIELLLLLLSFTISVHMFYKRDAGGVLLIYLLATLSAYLLAIVCFPLLFPPQRHLAYPLPLYAAISVPLSLNYLFRYATIFLKNSSVSRFVTGALIVSMCSIFVGPGSSDAGLTVRLKDNVLFQQINKLPDGVMIAGWPNGIVQNIPYVSRRKILLSEEIHQAIHTTYTLQMRRRMNAIIDAYFANTIEPIVYLRNEFGVSHLVIDKQQFRTRRLRYFVPFGPMIKARMQSTSVQELVIPKLYEIASIWQNKRYALLDLSRL